MLIISPVLSPGHWRGRVQEGGGERGGNKGVGQGLGGRHWRGGGLMANHAVHKAVTSGSQGVPALSGVSSSKQGQRPNLQMKLYSSSPPDITLKSPLFDGYYLETSTAHVAL